MNNTRKRSIIIGILFIAAAVFSILGLIFYGPNFMLGINTLLYSSLLFATRLVPRPLATLGMVGAVSVFTAAILEMFGVIEQVSLWGGLLALPVALFEMSLAVYLLVKGFKSTATIFQESKTGSASLAAAQ